MVLEHCLIVSRTDIIALGLTHRTLLTMLTKDHAGRYAYSKYSMLNNAYATVIYRIQLHLLNISIKISDICADNVA